jgi:hypothetical protein
VLAKRQYSDPCQFAASRAGILPAASARGGAIVWKWIASEHLDEFGFAPNELNLIRNAKTADYLHVNIHGLPLWKHAVIR